MAVFHSLPNKGGFLHQPSVNKSLTTNKAKSTKKTKTASKICGFFAPCENFVLFKNKGIAIYA
jgi:hypothetical protein